MTQIEEIAKFVFKNGMTEQEFFQQMFAELMLRNRATAKKISVEEVKKEKGKDGLCDYELWTKGLTRSVFKSGGLIEHPADLFSILNNSYTYRRYTNFPDYTDAQKKRMNAAMVDTADVHEFEQGGFYFRTLKGWKKPGHSLARFQINADMNPQMLKDLDNFMKRHNSVYKTTPPDEWAERTDTVNIYMYEPVTENIKKEIVQIMKPYVRKSLPSHINSIDGELLADGIGFAREAHEEECRPLIDRYPPHLRRNVRNYLSDMSLGSLRVAEEFLDMYQKYAPRLRGNTLSQAPKITAPKPQTPAKPQPTAPQKPATEIPQVASPKVNPSNVTMQDLMKELSLMNSEIQSMRTKLTGIVQENRQLRSQNRKLRARIQAAFPVTQTTSGPSV